MPRRHVPFLPDHYYHFFNRGNNHQTVFFERENYLYFIYGIKKYLLRYVDILAYCLLPTHYHILLRVKQPKTSEVLETSEVLTSLAISKAMMQLGVSHTKAINKRFNRVGTLFQGQFHGKLVQTYSHLLILCAYIHGNPVKHGLVSDPEEWEFSNYHEWLGKRSGTLVNQDFIKENFDSTKEYKQWMIDYIRSNNIPEAIKIHLQDLEK